MKGIHVDGWNNKCREPVMGKNLPGMFREQKRRQRGWSMVGGLSGWSE